MIATALAIYGIFLLIFGVASFFALYQIWQFGYVGDASIRVIILYAATSTLVILGSIVAFFIALS